MGQAILSGPGADIRPGNALPLSGIPVGTVIHAVELKPGGGAKMARSAGAGVQLLAKEGGNATLRMPSGEIRHGATPGAGPRSARWGTPSTSSYPGARPDATGGAASARRFAVWP